MPRNGRTLRVECGDHDTALIANTGTTAMDDRSEDRVTQRLAPVRKYVRIFAGFWLVLGAALLALCLWNLAAGPRGQPFEWGAAAGALAMIGAGLLFWKAVSWFTTLQRRQLATVQDEPATQMHRLDARTAHGEHVYMETSPRGGNDGTRFVQEDAYGRVVFDNTRRRQRLYAGLFGIGLGVVVFGLVYVLWGDFGAVEYIAMAGWLGWALIVMGAVHEVSLNRREQTVERRAGWLFIVSTRRLPLREFDRVVVQSTLFRARHDPARGRTEGKDPRFSVDLLGDRRLNLRVFGSLADARRMADEMGAHLGFPVAEDVEVR